MGAATVVCKIEPAGGEYICIAKVVWPSRLKDKQSGVSACTEPHRAKTNGRSWKALDSRIDN